MFAKVRISKQRRENIFFKYMILDLKLAPWTFKTVKQNWGFLKNIFSGLELSYFLFLLAVLLRILKFCPETLESGLYLWFLGVYGRIPLVVSDPVDQKKISENPRIIIKFGTPAVKIRNCPCAKKSNMMIQNSLKCILCVETWCATQPNACLCVRARVRGR